MAGCGDGTVRLYDRRLNSNDAKVMTYREHNNWIVKARMKAGGAKIVTADATGKVKFWNDKSAESLSTLQTMASLTAVDVHDNLDIFAVGSAQQFIGVLTHEGGVLSTIKYHDGFMGQRIGPISCMSFHPYKVSNIFSYL